MPDEQRPIVDAEWAFNRYEQLRDRLPVAPGSGSSVAVANLDAVADQFDAFVFDSFGVLNVGATPIDGAKNRIAALRKAGKQVFVLTNAASWPLAALPDKYDALGFDFSANEIVSSREILANALATYPSKWTWAIAAPVHSDVAELNVPSVLIDLSRQDWTEADGIILLSAQTLNDAMLDAITDALVQRPRPVLVGNPDLVAPREAGCTLEPGHYAHLLNDQLGIKPAFFGKPYANAFDEIKTRIGPDFDPARIAMIGDTLHTDILGGAAAGLNTVLVTGHGVLKELNVADCIEVSGIVPDYIVPSI